MRERKYVKFRVDMYDDTKFKIIDRRPERDLIHYIWNRLVVLSGRINLEGDLYYSKTLPHTIETLSIEFNREAYEVKSAMDVLLELQMLELTEDKVYRVKNFAKHQNIKPKEKIEATDTPKIENKIETTVDQTKVVEQVENTSCLNIEAKNKETQVIDNNIAAEVPKALSLNVLPIIFETKKNKKRKNSKTDTFVPNVDENTDVIEEITLIEGEVTLAEGEQPLSTWFY